MAALTRPFPALNSARISFVFSFVRIARTAAIAILSSSLLFAACSGGDSAESPSTQRPQAATETVSPTAMVTAPTATATPPPTEAPSPTPTATEPPPTATPPAPAATAAPQPTSAPRASAVTLTFHAANQAFDRASVSVPAGTAVTAIFQNDDAGLEHNLTFSLPGLGHGETCKGPCSTTQTFTAGTAGSYYFLCTLHNMVGTFAVTP